MSYINAIAPILLGQAAEQFAEHLALLIENPDAFEAQGLSEVYDFDTEQLEEYEPNELPEEFFTEFAYSKDITVMIDWKGEEDEGQFDDFVASRLQAYSKPSLSSELTEAWEASFDLEGANPGDYILAKFSFFGAELEKQGMALVFFNTLGDCYWPFVIPAEAAEQLPDAPSSDDEAYVHSYRDFDEETEDEGDAESDEQRQRTFDQLTAELKRSGMWPADAKPPQVK